MQMQYYDDQWVGRGTASAYIYRALKDGASAGNYNVINYVQFAGRLDFVKASDNSVPVTLPSVALTSTCELGLWAGSVCIELALSWL